MGAQMPTEEDDQSWEINPGGNMGDPDYSPESWATMTASEYEMVIANYADDFDSVEEVLRNMPRAVYDEYAERNFPFLPEELRPDYEEPENEPYYDPDEEAALDAEEAEEA
jgi:hypothetical protein